MKNVYFKDTIFDGFGAILTRHLLCYCLAKRQNNNFVFPGFRKIIMENAVGQHDISKNYWKTIINERGESYLDELTHFINFNPKKDNEESEFLTWDNVIKETKELISFKHHLKELKRNIQYDGDKYFTKKSVCWHIRVPNMQYDFQKSINDKRRELGIPSQQRINNVIALAKSKLNDFKLYVISNDDGLQSKMNFDCDVEFKLNDDMLTDLYHMIHADLLICANSSYSFCAYLLNGGEVAIRDNVVIPTFSDSIFLNSDYEVKK